MGKRKSRLGSLDSKKKKKNSKRAARWKYKNNEFLKKKTQMDREGAPRGRNAARQKSINGCDGKKRYGLAAARTVIKTLFERDETNVPCMGIYFCTICETHHISKQIQNDTLEIVWCGKE